VLVYGTPVKSPTIIRTITASPALEASSVAVDSTGETYVLNTPGFERSEVLSYPPSADGNATPDRTLSSPKGVHWNGNIAVDDKFLYVGGKQQVLVYDKRSAGSDRPFAILDVPSAPISYGSGPFVHVGP
jgi:hypothetical protein